MDDLPILSKLWAKLTDAPNFMARDSRYARYRIGEWTYGKPAVLHWGEGANLTIGRFCSIAPGVTIILVADHRSDWVTSYPFNKIFPQAEHFTGHPATRGDVSIGHDVWIGYHATILSGVTIGNGAVIAAESVVTKDVPPYCIVAGNPAREIRFRFPESTIAALQRIAWWDWPLPKIMQALPLLLSANLDSFIAHYDHPFPSLRS